MTPFPKMSFVAIKNAGWHYVKCLVTNLYKMAKLIIPLFLCCIIAFACGQANVSISHPAVAQEKLAYDTGRIAILPLDSIHGHWLFGKASGVQLTNGDLKIIDSLLNECINQHNSKQDTTKRFSEYIDLHRYRLQYIAANDSTGERKIYINGFCFIDGDADFDYWRKALVTVDDGGSCFFHLTINLNRKKYGHLFTNGYG